MFETEKHGCTAHSDETKKNRRETVDIRLLQWDAVKIKQSLGAGLVTNEEINIELTSERLKDTKRKIMSSIICNIISYFLYLQWVAPI